MIWGWVSEYIMSGVRAECIEGERSDLFGCENILIFEIYMRVRDCQ